MPVRRTEHPRWSRPSSEVMQIMGRSFTAMAARYQRGQRRAV
ncbi:hypothetical protein ACFPK5_18945 [Streptomyces beijiangensis]